MVEMRSENLFAPKVFESLPVERSEENGIRSGAEVKRKVAIVLKWALMVFSKCEWAGEKKRYLNRIKG